MRMPTGAGVRPLLLCFTLAACGGPQMGRIGGPVALPNRGPSSACERQRWYELAPTRVTATGATAGIGVNTYYSQVREGIGVYRVGEKDPEDLEEVWPALHERELERAHQARIEPVDDASTRSTAWALGGILGLGVGVGTAAAISEKSPTGAAVVGVSGLVIGLVGVVGALAAQPSGRAQIEADTRRRLFLAGEDDPVAVLRGTDGANAAQRARCGGRPVPFSLPERAAPRAKEPRGNPSGDPTGAPPAPAPNPPPVSPNAVPPTPAPADELPPLKAGGT